MVTTRGFRAPSYTLITSDNHFVSRLPALPGASVIKLVTPRLAPARLGQYLVSFGADPLHAVADAVLWDLPPGREVFLFGLTPGATLISEVLGGEIALGARGFAYVPASAPWSLRGEPGARLLWLTRRYEPWPDLGEPPAVHGDAEQVLATETATPGLHRRELLDPRDPRHDFNMSLMSFAPGVGLPQIEIHDEEHGLYMTAGDGIYTLERDEHAVTADDFIYMAPYCPQGFIAGSGGAEYLLYKDVYRDGF